MPITVHEKFACQVEVGQNGGGEFEWHVRGTDDRAAALNAVLTGTPTTFDPYGGGAIAYPRTKVRLIPLSLDEWQAVVTYGAVNPANIDPGMHEPEELFSFDITAGMRQIRTSLSTVGLYKRPADPNPVPDYKRAIGVTKDGEVQGVEVPVPQASFTETRYFAGTEVDHAYVRKLNNLIGAVNGAPFNGFAAGEVRFMGAAGQRRGYGDWEVKFRFDLAANETNIVIGDIETILQKNGWDYLWTQMREEKDTSAKRVVETPAYAYVERVSPMHDLADVFVTG